MTAEIVTSVTSRKNSRANHSNETDAKDELMIRKQQGYRLSRGSEPAQSTQPQYTTFLTHQSQSSALWVMRSRVPGSKNGFTQRSLGNPPTKIDTIRAKSENTARVYHHVDETNNFFFSRTLLSQQPRVDGEECWYLG